MQKTIDLASFGYPARGRLDGPDARRDESCSLFHLPVGDRSVPITFLPMSVPMFFPACTTSDSKGIRRCRYLEWRVVNNNDGYRLDLQRHMGSTASTTSTSTSSARIASSPSRSATGTSTRAISPWPAEAPLAGDEQSTHIPLNGTGGAPLRAAFSDDAGDKDPTSSYRPTMGQNVQDPSVGPERRRVCGSVHTESVGI
jgi:hypothetical protein